ncbi:TPA: hypothetical protein QCI26_004940 [Enterobacter soli]|nr:hypothetical protein [Enterobacter soli]HDR2475171.1 hypothetical protein [Enterobacter soli]
MQRKPIGDRVWVGGKSVILPGVKIGNDVVIAAGSVVTRDIPDRAIAGGCPPECQNRFSKGE